METAHGSTAGSASATITDEWCQHHFDHLAPELAAALPETMARMRSMCPVAHSDRYDGFWVVTDYEDVLAVAQDWETFSSAHGLTVPPSPIAVRNLPVEIDPPLHRIFKRLINAYFTPAAVAPWEDRSRALVTDLVDAFVEEGQCDFMTDFARPYPALSFFEAAINAPAEEVARVAYLASKSGTPNDPEAAVCWMALSQWINDFVEQRRRSGRKGDVVDAVIEAEIEGRPITQEEIIGTVQLLVLGGLETTAGALGSMMIRFCAEPDLAEMLRRAPELIPHAVEEMLRLDGPFISITRTVMRDTEIGGHALKAGEKVIIYWAGANRDGTEFPDPDRFDIDRKQNRHLAFGAGPHRCAGSNLARLNLRVALEELLPRLRDLKLQEGADIHFHSTFNRAPFSVPICFSPAARVGRPA
jgi:cytochrome P450